MKAAAAMTETQLLAAVRDLCQLRGCMTYHTHRSDRSEPGFPDLVILTRTSVLYRELKTTKGRLTTAQAAWLDRLTSLGADAGVWQPEHLHAGVIDAELRAISPKTSRHHGGHIPRKGNTCPTTAAPAVAEASASAGSCSSRSSF
jgi:hypothetical protein